MVLKELGPAWWWELSISLFSGLYGFILGSHSLLLVHFLLRLSGFVIYVCLDYCSE